MIQKLISYLFIFIYSFTTYADINFEIVGACQKEAIYKETSTYTSTTSVGHLTIDTLEQQNIPFIGSAEGIKTIFSIPSKENELLIISDTELLAYGWCYKVNGLAPEVYPHKVEVLDGDHIEWYFAFSRYLDGEWVSQCKPSYLEPRQEFCSK